MAFTDKAKPVATSTPSFLKKAKPIAQPQKSEPSFIQRATLPYAQRQSKRTDDLLSTQEALETGEQGFASSAFQTGGNIIGSAIAPITEGIKTVDKSLGGIGGKALGLAFAPVGVGVRSVADRISDFKAVQDFAMSKAGKTTARNIEAGQEYLNLLPVPRGIKAGGIVGEKALDATSGAIKAGKEAVEYAMTPTEKVVDDFILKTYTKAVKPTVKGKQTLGNLEKSQEQAVRAVKLIADKKAELKFTDEAGDVITGRTPESLSEFADSIGQTKSSIYKQFNDVAVKAGKAGAEVDTTPIAGELDAVINNKALRISHPEAVQYAKAVKDRYLEVGTLDTETAQELIKNYNSSLESFYRNPSYDNASKAAIDAALVNNLRKSLDDVIEKTTGAEYQSLKNDYGALKAIEADVVKRATVEARKQAKGLIDYTDIFSGGDIVSGILTANPALFARGVAQKGIKEYFKLLNDPNRAVRKMFEKAQVETKPDLPVVNNPS